MRCASAYFTLIAGGSPAPGVAAASIVTTATSTAVCARDRLSARSPTRPTSPDATAHLPRVKARRTLELHSRRGCDTRGERRRTDARRRLAGCRRGRAARLARCGRARADAGGTRGGGGGRAWLPRAHVLRQHGLRPLRVATDPGGADGGIAAAAAALARLRGRRAVSGRGGARRDAAARERARARQLRRAHRDGRAAALLPRARRAPPRAVTGIRRRLGRPCAARAPRAAAGR